MASSDNNEMTLGPGFIVGGRYRVEGLHTRGVGPAIYRAHDLIRDRPVALRLVPPALCDEDLAPRLELRLTRNARLPRAEVPALVDLLDIIDLGRDESGRLLVVTDLHPTASLADLLASEGPLPWQRLRDLMVRACQLVHLSHEHGIVRQDLQTRSLYPVRDKAEAGTLKIVSPGLLVAGDRVWSCATPATALALARYAAPEQISTHVVDRRTDVYALGVILYECLTGAVPFADPRPAHVVAAHLITPPPPFPEAVRRRGVPPELEAIVARALAKSPDDRYPTVMALANAMAAIEFGRCEFSGVLETNDASDLTELLEPQASSTSMRVDAARLSGRAGLVPASDAAATGEHAWRDILDVAESTSGLHRPDDTSASATLGRNPGDSTPTLPFGLASDSAARWSAAPPPPPRASPPLRRIAPWAVAAGLALFTAGIVTAVIVNLAQRPPPAASASEIAHPLGAKAPAPASPSVPQSTQKSPSVPRIASPATPAPGQSAEAASGRPDRAPPAASGGPAGASIDPGDAPRAAHGDHSSPPKTAPDAATGAPAADPGNPAAQGAPGGSTRPPASPAAAPDAATTASAPAPQNTPDDLADALPSPSGGDLTAKAAVKPRSKPAKPPPVAPLPSKPSPGAQLPDFGDHEPLGPAGSGLALGGAPDPT